MQSPRYFVAGGTGAIGTAVVQRLARLGLKVSASYHVRPPAIHPDVYKNYDFTVLDDCLRATESQDYVILCAALTHGAKMTTQQPSASILPNLKMQSGLLEACHRNGVKKVLLISSATVYQKTDHPVAERELDLNEPPFDAYLAVGWLNRYIEQLASFYARSCGMKVGIVRPTSAYGPFESFDEDRGHVIPSLIKRALKKEDPFVVWGDGSQVRDFIYVDDVVDDILTVLDSYCCCDPVNVGYGEGTVLRDLVPLVLRVCRHNAVIQYDKTKPIAIPYRTVDTSRFRKLFGDCRRVSLEDGLKKTADWYLASNP